jgi:hypothetical protein
MKIQTGLLLDMTVSRLWRMRTIVDMNPPYQREGAIWPKDTRSRLIDSILNGLDVPKLYFERAPRTRSDAPEARYEYAVIDGKQRLEAILDFYGDNLALADDFVLYEDKSVQAAGMRLSDLRRSYPFLAQRLDSFELPVVSVTTDSGDLIEEMFQRLNASTALNAAERRNAYAGPTREAANALAKHVLLETRSPIRNARYKYRELGAKFLAIEHQLHTREKILDTKAATLLRLFIATRGDHPDISAQAMESYHRKAEATLDRMATVFVDDDPLLGSIGTVVVYYIAFRDTEAVGHLDRNKLDEFEVLRKLASAMPETDPDYNRGANARLREYNVFVQSTNDGRALTWRANLLKDYVRGFAPEDPLAGLDNLPDGELPEGDDEDGDTGA